MPENEWIFTDTCKFKVVFREILVYIARRKRKCFMLQDDPNRNGRVIVHHPHCQFGRFRIHLGASGAKHIAISTLIGFEKETFTL